MEVRLRRLMTRETLTDLLPALQRGDADARSRAFEVLYEELRRAAHAHRRRWGGNPTLGTTGLVHEAYVKLLEAERLEVAGRGHFLALASRAMRHLLSNHARDQQRLKRGGGLRRTGADIEDVPEALPLQDLETIIALDDALVGLEEVSERSARVVECRFFAGLSVAETAEALGIGAATVKRDWVFARDWLYRAVTGVEAV